MGLFKSQQPSKMAPFQSNFASCSQVCTYSHVLSDRQFGWLFHRFLRLL